MYYIIALIIAYLLGSFPTSVIAGKWFYGIDIREHGSGNAGATNTIRVLGWKVGLPVFIIDVLKGFIAVNLIKVLHIEPNTNQYALFQLSLGFAALLGHVFPIFAGFRGGKGVATLLGVVIALSPIPALLSFIVFIVILIIFKYVSVGSIIALLSYPIIICFFYSEYPLTLKIASVIMTIVVVLTHRKNIRRLINGNESKATFLWQKKEN